MQCKVAIASASCRNFFLTLYLCKTFSLQTVASAFTSTLLYSTHLYTTATTMPICHQALLNQTHFFPSDPSRWPLGHMHRNSVQSQKPTSVIFLPSAFAFALKSVSKKHHGRASSPYSEDVVHVVCFFPPCSKGKRHGCVFFPASLQV